MPTCSSSRSSRSSSSSSSSSSSGSSGSSGSSSSSSSSSGSGSSSGSSSGGSGAGEQQQGDDLLPTDFEATRLAQLLRIRGSQSAPVVGVQLLGLRFVDAAATFLAPHGIPSGGDWALHRGGSLVIEGTRGTLVEGCAFERVDGTAVLISGYNRNVTVQRSSFAWVGENGVALWGDTRGGAYVTDAAQKAALPAGMGPDGTGGNFARFTKVLGNFARELGVWEKQSAFFFQAKSCQTEVRGNIAFNLPRASVNFNDGFGGGSSVADNLMFNTCRESGNHGVFNSWDRQPYVTTVFDGKTPSTQKLDDVLSGNFFVANYQAGFAIDNDDASMFYRAHGNFLVYGDNGLKADFGGHDNVHFENIYAFPNIGCLVDITEQLLGHGLTFFGNKCVMQQPGGSGLYAHFNCDDLADGANATRAVPLMHDNQVYASDGALSICGRNLTQLQLQGFELGTTVAPIPAAGDILGWARTLLQLSQQR